MKILKATNAHQRVGDNYEGPAGRTPSDSLLCGSTKVHIWSKGPGPDVCWTLFGMRSGGYVGEGKEEKGLSGYGI